MNTRITSTRRFDEQIANTRATPRGNQVHPLEEVANDDKAPVIPPPLTDGDIRDAFLQMAQAITSQEQSVTTHAQAMTTQANRGFVPWANQHVGTKASCLRDFIGMNPPTFYGSEVEADPQEFIDETYNILFVKG